ncbi:942_t:CDS:2, partial [Gigaspora rosea]
NDREQEDEVEEKTYDENESSSWMDKEQQNKLNCSLSTQQENPSNNSKLTKDLVNINSYFSDGFIIEDTINNLVSGKLQPNDLPIIRAIKKGAVFTKIPVKIIRKTNDKAYLKWKMDGSLRVIPNNIWSNIIVSSYSQA